jgi:hypothetical protein
MSNLTPIAVFAFNRPDLLEKTLHSLSLCYSAEESKIFFFIDGPRNNKDIGAIASCVLLVEKYRSNFKTVKVIKSQINSGLARSLKRGISTVLEESEAVIVLEDDLLVEKCFIDYMNSQLSFYKEIKKVGSISGFSTKVSQSSYFNYFHPRPCSWGWATWKDRWEKAVWTIDDFEINELKVQKKDFNSGGEDLYRMLMNQLSGRINSWAILWSYTHFKNDWVASYPTKSLLSNIGFGDSATHCKGINPFPYQLINIQSVDLLSYCPNVYVDKNVVKQVNKYHSNIFKVYTKILNKIKS